MDNSTTIHRLADNDKHNRDLFAIRFINARLVNRIKAGHAIGYPNCGLITHRNDAPVLTNPYDDKIMSLQEGHVSTSHPLNLQVTGTEHLAATEENKTSIGTTLFFFLYHFDNYYHFLYDTMPMLMSYIKLKEIYPDKKWRLLIQSDLSPNYKFFAFNADMIAKIVPKQEWVHLGPNATWFHTNELWVPSSYTHGTMSNEPPRPELYAMFAQYFTTGLRTAMFSSWHPKAEGPRIYISRRTWVHNKLDNIGTNYTTRRKLINEDALVSTLVDDLGFNEIFTEHMTTDEKINLFTRASLIIGCIGGGMANLLFSTQHTKAVVIVSPGFLDVNKRFVYSFWNADTYLYDRTYSYVEDPRQNISLYTRVRTHKTRQIGEVIRFDPRNNTYDVQIHETKDDARLITGFDHNDSYKVFSMKEDDMTCIDNGLNSPFCTDIKDLTRYIKFIEGDSSVAISV